MQNINFSFIFLALTAMQAFLIADSMELLGGDRLFTFISGSITNSISNSIWLVLFLLLIPIYKYSTRQDIYKTIFRAIAFVFLVSHYSVILMLLYSWVSADIGYAIILLIFTLVASVLLIPQFLIYRHLKNIAPFSGIETFFSLYIPITISFIVLIFVLFSGIFI